MRRGRWQQAVRYAYPLTATYLTVMTTLVLLLLLLTKPTC